MSDEELIGRRRVEFMGPSRFCPCCSRILVAMLEDGNMIVSQDVHIWAMIDPAEYEPDEDFVMRAKHYGFTATCLRCHPETLESDDAPEARLSPEDPRHGPLRRLWNRARQPRLQPPIP